MERPTRVAELVAPERRPLEPPAPLPSRPPAEAPRPGGVHIGALEVRIVGAPPAAAPAPRPAAPRRAAPQPLSRRFGVFGLAQN